MQTRLLFQLLIRCVTGISICISTFKFMPRTFEITNCKYFFPVDDDEILLAEESFPFAESAAHRKIREEYAESMQNVVINLFQSIFLFSQVSNFCFHFLTV